MTHTRHTSIGASAQFLRQNRRFRGQEFVYQSSHVLKESLGGRIFRSQDDGRGIRASGTRAGAAGFYFSVGVTDDRMLTRFKNSSLHYFSLSYRGADAGSKLGLTESG
jgi:hypothetical protein